MRPAQPDNFDRVTVCAELCRYECNNPCVLLILPPGPSLSVWTALTSVTRLTLRMEKRTVRIETEIPEMGAVSGGLENSSVVYPVCLPHVSGVWKE